MQLYTDVSSHAFSQVLPYSGADIQNDIQNASKSGVGTSSSISSSPHPRPLCPSLC